jgi:hypothetical protein
VLENKPLEVNELIWHMKGHGSLADCDTHFTRKAEVVEKTKSAISGSYQQVMILPLKPYI